METYNISSITKKIYDSRLHLFTSKTLRDILGVWKENTTFNIIQRLIRGNVLYKIERNKYILKDASVSDFSLACFLYHPSYISFETALNFHGILSQFPYCVTSATTRKTIQKNVESKQFSYFHIKKDLFWGYDKKDDFLIASAEKALLDQLYFTTKGLKKTDLEDYDLSAITVSRLKEYIKEYPDTVQWKKIVKQLKKHSAI